MQKYILQNSISINRFHGIDNESSYVLSYNEKNWKVSQFVIDVLNCIKHGANSYEILLQQISKTYEADNIEESLKHTIAFFEQNGLFCGTNSVSERKTNNKFLWGRVTVIPSNMVQKITFLCFLFKKPLLPILSVLSAAWVIIAIFTMPAFSLSNIIIQLPISDILICYGIMSLIGFLHEIGHTSALSYCGEKPGRIGIAFYLLSFVFFSEVTNAWKLNKAERLLVDFGGILFQCIFSLLLFLINKITLNSFVIELAALLEAIIALDNFNPFFKFDGYWMLSDILGTTNVKKEVTRFWKNVINLEPKKNNKKTNIIILLYSLGAFFYLIYFSLFVFSALKKAITVIYSDIMLLFSSNIIISFSAFWKYFINRFPSYMLLILITRLLYKCFLNIICYLNKGRTNYGNS